MALTLTNHPETLLTSQQAADFLNVSHSFLMKLIENEELSEHRVEGDRYIRFDELMAYKQNIDEERRKVLTELVREAQELEMGY
jgi:excisionase family DNA binding protein